MQPYPWFEGLPRQGPGLNECTARAFNSIPGLPKHPRILDIGCGSGVQSLQLATICPVASITAVDIYPPFLEDLEHRARKSGLDDRITTVRASMDDLPFPGESFDLFWSEGASFVMGFREAPSYWRQFLEPDGYLGITDLFWFTHTPSEECRQFFEEQYPSMVHEEAGRDMIRDAGYSVLDMLRLPDAAWWNDYYNPLSRTQASLKTQYPGDQEKQALFGSIEEEIEMFRHHSAEYGHSFFYREEIRD